MDDNCAIGNFGRLRPQVGGQNSSAANRPAFDLPGVKFSMKIVRTEMFGCDRVIGGRIS